MLKLYEITGEYLTLCQMAEDTWIRLHLSREN